MNRAHSRVGAATVVSNIFLVVLSIIIRRHVVVYAIIYLLTQTTLLCGWLLLQPMHLSVVQHYVVAVASLPWWAGVCNLILVSGRVSAEVRNGMTIMLIAGAIPCACVFAVVSKYARSRVAALGQGFVAAVSDTPPAYQAAVESYEPYVSIRVMEVFKVREEKRGEKRRGKARCERSGEEG